ncbi:hypothetical protein BaRGS_00001854 [Batillaria attramentaria]|uniref:Uncharacterized protein n=1 Tax=Batillaria attramentaria TaxID=370345 RepID=A0ABD0M742_9CAEN
MASESNDKGYQPDTSRDLPERSRGSMVACVGRVPTMMRGLAEMFHILPPLSGQAPETTKGPRASPLKE